MHANGSFEVKMSPQTTHEAAAGAGLGRMSMSKRFQGDLDGTSIGEMLAVRTDVEGSAGYVAIEIVNATLQGRSGSFILQHSSTMARGVPHQNVTVVPDSGTGQLVGLTGQLVIHIADGKHSYEFEYTLSESP